MICSAADWLAGCTKLKPVAMAMQRCLECTICAVCSGYKLSTNHNPCQCCNQIFKYIVLTLGVYIKSVKSICCSMRRRMAQPNLQWLLAAAVIEIFMTTASVTRWRSASFLCRVNVRCNKALGRNLWTTLQFNTYHRLDHRSLPVMKMFLQTIPTSKHHVPATV